MDQIGISWINLFYVISIICFQVKIIFPEILKILLAAVKPELFFLLRDNQASASSTDPVSSLFYSFHPKTLSGITDLSQIKMFYLSFYHLVSSKIVLH